MELIRRRKRRGSHKGRSTASCQVGGRRCHTSSQLLQRTTQKSSIISSPMPDEIVHHHFTSNPAGRGQITGSVDALVQCLVQRSCTDVNDRYETTIATTPI
jgi:hypothetical protein